MYSVAQVMLKINRHSSNSMLGFYLAVLKFELTTLHLLDRCSAV
jgi:hypothetical protein